jgi:hypothetical protein
MKPTTALGWGIVLMIGMATARAAELPIRQIVLYKHGIGYFLRSGQLGPNDTVQLDFNASEMNDVLKSLTLQESGTGSISGLRYDSSDPLEKKLAEFPFKIGPGQPLTAILDQLKGAAVEMRTGSETIRGTLVSGRLVPRTEQRPESEQITLLSDSGEFRNVDLSAVSSLRFQDTALQTQFQEYLSTLNTARSRDKRSLYIDSTGSQTRDVTASYMIPMPVWKSSYRLIFPDSGQPTLEGWAIVDNTTGDDWSNVQLSLVSGRPISFISRLYEPRYINRPVAELPEDRAAVPVIYGGAIEATSEVGTIAGVVRDDAGAVIPGARITIRNAQTGSVRNTLADQSGNYRISGLTDGTYEVIAEFPGFQSSIRSNVRVSSTQGASVSFTLNVGEVAQSVMVQGMADEAMMAKEMAASRSFGRMELPAAAAPSAIASTAAAQELGELFEYSFSTPVTVGKSESAMLPFLQEKLTARKLLVFTEQGSVNPLHSVEITNSTGKTLDGGPITVYDANAYAGEALVETLKKGDKRLLSYGVDLGTRISTALDSQSQIVREIHVNRGLLTTKTAAVETKTYTINNVDQEAKTLIIQHPIRREYKVMNQTPKETTATHYRFEVPLSAGETEKYPVTEERVYETSVGIASMSPEILVTYIQNRSLSDAGRAQLQQIVDLKRQIATAEGEMQRTQQEINNLFQDQERIRQNINSLNRVAGQEQQVQAYSRHLAEQEAQLATLRDRLAQTQQRKVTLEGQLNDLIERMEF